MKQQFKRVGNSFFAKQKTPNTVFHSRYLITVLHFVFGIKHVVSFLDWVNGLSITKGDESES